MRWTGQTFWLLAFGACAASHLLPAFTPEKNFQGLAQWEVVSSYSSATAPDSHEISCADPLFQARKELERGLAACARTARIILSHSDESPAQRHNGAVGCQPFFLVSESLKDRVAFLTWSDCAGDVPKKIWGVLFDHTAKSFLKLRANVSSRVQLMLVILLPRTQRLCLCQNFLYELVAGRQLARCFKQANRATKPTAMFSHRQSRARNPPRSCIRPRPGFSLHGQPIHRGDEYDGENA